MTKKMKALATKTISCRVTEKEFNIVIQLAANAGMTKTKYNLKRFI